MYKLVDILRETLQEKVSIDKETIAKFIRDNGIIKKAGRGKDSLQAVNDKYYKTALANRWLEDLFPTNKLPADYNSIAKFIKDNNITKRTSKVKDKHSLSGANNRYYMIAWRNGWLDSLLPMSQESDEDLFKRMQAAVIDSGNSRDTFKHKHSNLYKRAREMKLMDKLFGQRARTKEKFIDLATKSWHDSGGKPLYDYSKTIFKGMGEPVTINCPKKGHGPFDVSKASNHLNYKGRPGQGCPKCKCEASTQNFIEKAQAIHGDLYGYDKVDYCNPEYQRRDTNTGTPKWYFPIYCKKHQRYFEQRSDIHLGDHGCPACAESKGEAELKNYFAKKGVKIDIGNFENCTNKKTGKACRRLPFDVYVPDLNVIVEFDGKQHFQDVPYFFKDKEGYKDQVRRDKLKNDFCKEEGNPKLIRISYMTPFNQISSVLDTLLKKAKTSSDKIILASDYPKAGWNT